MMGSERMNSVRAAFTVLRYIRASTAVSECSGRTQAWFVSLHFAINGGCYWIAGLLPAASRPLTLQSK
ncbi:hypothetical protein ALO68_200036 [Pseudomonas syringae pv. helianthi]|uniref:Integrase n=1 Tax=Pseudomonas syringae pv. helianthi TaxID=251654 RepID=A0A0P9RDP6_9PSED|nr:hypothetical protein ALO68_200036 [Pseudomonas syringae pv. helianthi]